MHDIMEVKINVVIYIQCKVHMSV